MHARMHTHTHTCRRVACRPSWTAARTVCCGCPVASRITFWALTFTQCPTITSRGVGSLCRRSRRRRAARTCVRACSCRPMLNQTTVFVLHMCCSCMPSSFTHSVFRQLTHSRLPTYSRTHVLFSQTTHYARTLHVLPTCTCTGMHIVVCKSLLTTNQPTNQPTITGVFFAPTRC